MKVLVILAILAAAIVWSMVVVDSLYPEMMMFIYALSPGTVSSIGLISLTAGLVYCASVEIRIKRADAKERATPRVKAWLDHNWRSEPTLDLVIANLGMGDAQDVKWWFEDVDKTDWKKRVELINWPDSENTAWHVGFLRSREEIRITLASGRDLYAPEGTSSRRQKTHYPVTPFSVEIRFDPLPGTAGKAEPFRARLSPRMAYPLNTGSSDGLHRIADAIERIAGRNWYGEHPDKGMPASAPSNPDWEEQQAELEKSTTNS